MDATKVFPFKQSAASSRLGLLIPALFLMVAAIIFGIFIVTEDSASGRAFQDLYLLPWIGMAAAVIIAPSAYLYHRGKFDFAHPLVFAAFSYFIPAFVFGGLFLASGLVQPYFMHFVEDPHYNLPLTFVYIALGFGGMTFGFFLPHARRIGEFISRRAPLWDWQPSSVLLPAMLLLGAGSMFYFSAWFSGIVGYSQIDLNDSTSTLQYFLSLLFLEAGFLIWMAVFKTKQWHAGFTIALLTFLSTIPIRVILGGNRASLIQLVIVVVLAFVLAGRKFKLQQVAIFGTLAAVALTVGMIYGTTFRNIKGSESKNSLSEYLDNAALAVESIGREDIGSVISKGASDFAERIEVTSSLAVVVSNYEKLAPYEAAYGLENNIWTFTWTAFIPRFIWADKPVVSDARAYSELYFNFGENSFAITPIGDLLRNFGPVGVPLGMLLLGIVLRILYAALIENQEVTLGRATLYFMLLTIVSFEGFYGTIMPNILRVGFVAFISLAVVGFFISKHQRRI